LQACIVRYKNIIMIGTSTDLRENSFKLCTLQPLEGILERECLTKSSSKFSSGLI
jgi:hypothetical protein